MAIRVNFAKPHAVFPLDTPSLLPQQVLPLHIFEPRYRQMIDRALDSSGQIAMGTYKGSQWKKEYHGNPPIMPAVCIGQIVQHDQLADGRYNVILRGVCRARIASESMPDEDRMYRTALLEPVGLGIIHGDAPDRVRTWLVDALSDDPLRKLTVAEQVADYLKDDEVPTNAALELVSHALVQDRRMRYHLLAEGDINRRARLLEGEIRHLSTMIGKAYGQNPDEWPKGLSWN